MIFQLVYQSTAVRYFAPEELLDLLARSRANNARLQITGMLLYEGGRFLQLLEGGEAEVRERYAVISQDPRHKWVSLVMSGASAVRDFPDWTMGFRDLDLSKAAVKGWTSFLDRDDLPEDLDATASYVRKIFAAFRK